MGGREAAEAFWQAGVESEGSCSLVVKIKLLMCKYTQKDPNMSLGVWGQMGAEKAVAHHGIPALLTCLLSPHLPKALVVLLSRSGTAGPGQSMVSVLQIESAKTIWWKCGDRNAAYPLPGLWEHLQFL